MRNKLISIVIIFLFLSFVNSKTNDNKGYYKVHIIKNETNSYDTTVVISGRVMDLKNKKPLPYAIFKVKDFKFNCLTNDSGYFKIKIKSNTYQFIFTSIGNTDLVTKKIKILTENRYYFNVYLDSHILYNKNE